MTVLLRLGVIWVPMHFVSGRMRLFNILVAHLYMLIVMHSMDPHLVGLRWRNPETRKSFPAFSSNMLPRLILFSRSYYRKPSVTPSLDAFAQCKQRHCIFATYKGRYVAPAKVKVDRSSSLKVIVFEVCPLFCPMACQVHTFIASMFIWEVEQERKVLKIEGL